MGDHDSYSDSWVAPSNTRQAEESKGNRVARALSTRALPIASKPRWQRAKLATSG